MAWLSLLREVGLGGILADDMGLGKTVQALAFFTVEKAAGRLDRPALVVAPTSFMGNRAREAERFAPDLRVLVPHGPDRKAQCDAIPGHDLVLTTSPLAARDRNPWWNPAIEEQAIDRAHRIGQTRPVFVHKLVAAGTIEEKMEVLKQKKAALAASLFDPDGEPTLAMTEADIDMLLAS